LLPLTLSPLCVAGRTFLSQLTGEGEGPHKRTAKKRRFLPIYSLQKGREENTTFIRRKSCSIDFIPRNGKQPNISGRGRFSNSMAGENGEKLAFYVCLFGPREEDL
jgi:hypothetical protein